MMKDSFIHKIFATLILLFASIFSATALALTCTGQINSGQENTATLELKFSSPHDMKEHFREDSFLRVKFESEKLRFKNFSHEGFLRKTALQVLSESKNEGIVDVVLKVGLNFYRPTEPETLRFEFKIFENLYPCQTFIEAEFVDPENNDSLPVCRKVLNLGGNPQTEKCRLSSLTPHAGELTPCFCPENFEYDLYVGSNVKNLDFDASATDENLKVRINRRTLKPAGKSTDIKVKVSNPKIKNLSKTYTVHVHRAKADEENASEKVGGLKNRSDSGGKPKKEAKPKHKSKGRKRKSKTKYGETENDDENDDEDFQSNEDGENEEDCTENESEENSLANTQEKRENNPVRIYLILVFASAVVSLIAYLILKNLKSGSKKDKN